MCELFAASLAEPEPMNNLVTEFFSHSDKHPHGWGLALHTPFGINVEKEPVGADKSAYLKERLAEPIVTTDMVAHIRYATKGPVERINCHPFLGIDSAGNRWMLVHNGTLFDFRPVRPFLPLCQGETDSEAALLFLLDVVKRTTKDMTSTHVPTAHFRALDQAVIKLSAHNKANLIFNDGTFTYVHTNFLRQTLFSALYRSGRIFCSRPLSVGTWVRIPLARLLVFHAGELVFTGTPHENIYEENPADTKHLYHEYAML